MITIFKDLFSFILALPLLFILGMFDSTESLLSAQEITSRQLASANHPGGVALVSIRSKNRPLAHYNDQPVMVVADRQHWLAIVGIPLSADVGKHRLSVLTDGDMALYQFSVKNKEYSAQYLTIKNKRKVNPNTEDTQRIARESKLIKSAKSHWRDDPVPPLSFKLPLEGRVSSPFGLRRFFNKQPRNPHSGLDIAAPSGTPVAVAAAGRVINAGNYFFNGKSVFVDHGQGLITLYCHLSRIDVQEGQELSQGQILGAVGKTGRATGPHLHWSVILNQAMVDPVLFVEN